MKRKITQNQKHRPQEFAATTTASATAISSSMTESPQRSMTHDIKTKNRSSAEERAAAATSREDRNNKAMARSSDATKEGVTSMHHVDGHGIEERDAARALADLSHVASPSSLPKEDVGRPPPPPLDGGGASGTAAPQGTPFNRVSDDYRESSSQPSPLPGDGTNDGGKGNSEGAAAVSGQGGQTVLHNHIDVAGRGDRNNCHGPNRFSPRKRPAQRWDSSSSNSSNTTNTTNSSDGSPRESTDDPNGESSSMSDGGYDGGKSGSNSSDRGGSGSEEDGELNTNAGGSERACYLEGSGQGKSQTRGLHSHGHGNHHGQSQGQVALPEAKQNKKVSISLGKAYVHGDDDDRVDNFADNDYGEDDDDDEEMDQDEDARANESVRVSASERVGYTSSSTGSFNMENGSEKGEKSETTATTNATNVTSETASTLTEPASDVGKTHAVNRSSLGKVMGKTKTIPVKVKSKSKSQSKMSENIQVVNATASGINKNNNDNNARKNKEHKTMAETNATSSSPATKNAASDQQALAKIKRGCASITSNCNGNSTNGKPASSSASAVATNKKDYDATISSNRTAGEIKSDDSASGKAAAKLMPADMILRPAPYFYYVDHSNEPDDDPLEPLTPASRVPTFPSKMMALLTREDLSSIICWMPHGRSWRIITPREFELRVIPLYFEHSKFSSFIRQAKGWGFRRISEGGHKNCYYNEYFLRGLPHLIKKMPRPGASKKFELDPDHEPDLLKISREHPVPSQLSPDDLYASTLEAINDCILEGGPKARLPIVHISSSSKRSSNATMQTLASLLDRGKQSKQQKQQQQQQGAGLNDADDSSSDLSQKRILPWSSSTSSVATKRQKGNTTNGASCYSSDPTYSFLAISKNTGNNESDVLKDFDSTSSTISSRVPMGQDDNGSGNMNLNANSAVNSALNALLQYNGAQQQQQHQRQEQAMTPVDQSMTRQHQSIFQQQHQQLQQQPQPPTKLQRQQIQLLQQQRVQLEQFQKLHQKQSDESKQQEQQEQLIRRIKQLQEQQQIVATAAEQRQKEKEQRIQLQQQQQSLINEVISSLGVRPSQDQDQQQRQQPNPEVPVSAPSLQSHSQPMPNIDANSNASANLLAALYSQQQQQQHQPEQQSPSTNNSTPQPPVTLQTLLSSLQQQSVQQLQQSQTSANQTAASGVNPNNTMLGNPSIQENQSDFAKAYIENLVRNHLSGMNQPQNNNINNNQQQQQQQLQNRQEQQSSNHSLAAVASQLQQQLLANQQQQRQHHQQQMRPYKSPLHQTQSQHQSPHLSQVGSDYLSFPQQRAQAQSQQQQQQQQQQPQAPFNSQVNEKLRDMIMQAVAAGAQLGAEAITRSNNKWTSSPSSNQYGSNYFGPNGGDGGHGWNNNSNGGMPPNQR